MTPIEILIFLISILGLSFLYLIILVNEKNKVKIKDDQLKIIRNIITKYYERNDKNSKEIIERIASCILLTTTKEEYYRIIKRNSSYKEEKNI